VRGGFLDHIERGIRPPVAHGHVVILFVSRVGIRVKVRREYAVYRVDAGRVILEVGHGLFHRRGLLLRDFGLRLHSGRFCLRFRGGGVGIGGFGLGFRLIQQRLVQYRLAEHLVERVIVGRINLPVHVRRFPLKARHLLRENGRSLFRWQR